MTDYKVNEYAELFPMIEGPAYEEFKADIAANGLREPIVLLRGELIDGRNRHKACGELGIEPPIEHLPEDTNALIYVFSKNFHRRHLSVKQRGALAADLVTMKRGDNQYTETTEGSKDISVQPEVGGSFDPPTSGGVETEVQPEDVIEKVTAKVAAELTGVSEKTVKRAVKTKKADPEQHKKDKKGDKPVRRSTTKGKAAPSKSAGKPVAVAIALTGTPEEQRAQKTERDERQLNAAIKPVLDLFPESTLQAQKQFLRKLAREFNAEIHFAGEVMKAPPTSLVGQAWS